MCKKRKRCSIHNKIQEAIKDFPDPVPSGIEAVIYTCPAFDEEF